MKRGKLQCKDIPDQPILEILYEIGKTGRWGTWFRGNYDNSVAPAFPQEVPEKLIIAKMSTLIRRGLVDGCPCGCRGDYVMKESGYKLLAELKKVPFVKIDITGVTKEEFETIKREN